MNYHHDGRGKDVVNDLLLELARQSQGSRTLVQQGLGHQAQQPLAYAHEAYDSLLSPRGLTNLLASTEDQGAQQLLAEQLKHNLASNVQRPTVAAVDILGGDTSSQQQIDSLIRNLTTNGPSLGTSQAYLGHLGNLGQVDSLATELLHQQNHQHVLLQQQPSQNVLHQHALGISTSGLRLDGGGNGGKVGDDAAAKLVQARNRRHGREDSPPLSGRKRGVEDLELEEQLLRGARGAKRSGLVQAGRPSSSAVQTVAYNNSRDLYKGGQDELEAQLAEQVGRAQQQQQQQQQQQHQQQQQQQQQQQEKQLQLQQAQATRNTHQEKNREAQRRFREKQKTLMEDLRQRVQTLEQRNAFLVEENDLLKRDNQQLHDELRELRMQNAQLRVKIAK